jgi:hypothetical protein
MLWMVVLAVVVAIAAGCGGGSKSAKAVAGSTSSVVSPTASGVATEDHPSTPPPQNPCTLVTQAEAEAIIGAPIETPRMQPLGPTCVYQTRDSSTFLTMAVESINFNTVKSQIQNLAPVAGLGHQAFCGTFGRPAIFVVLDATRVLNVSAPCNLAQQFATKALPRVRL